MLSFHIVPNTEGYPPWFEISRFVYLISHFGARTPVSTSSVPLRYLCQRSPTAACKLSHYPLRYFSEKLQNKFLMPEFTPDLIAHGFIWFVAFLFSTTCHEASHALAAKLGGDDTAANQVTLNPVPHIQREPWGMVVIPILSFLINRSMIGWASAPFDPTWERRYPKRSGWMALAGPAANYTLMLLAVAALRVGFHYHLLHIDETTGNGDFATTALWIFFQLNLLLGTFNLLPCPPLDGSTVILLFMSEDTAHRYLDWLRGSNYARLGFLFALLFFYKAYSPFEDFATRLLFRAHF